MKVGDQVICLKSGDTLKKGKIYTIEQVLNLSCKCGMVIDVGIKDVHGDTTCRCGNTIATDDRRWYHYSLFAPITYNSAHDELCNIVEERIDIKQPIKVQI
jgi:hypothetical protein